MELFSVNLLLVLFYALMVVSPAIATSGSSEPESGIGPLGMQIPRYRHPGFPSGLPVLTSYSFPVIILSLVLNVVGMLGLAPLANGAFTRSPTRLRIVLAVVSLAEAGQASEHLLLFLCCRFSVDQNRTSLHWNPSLAA